MKKLFAYGLTFAALFAPARLWAGPSAVGMIANVDRGVAPSLEISTPLTFESLAAPVVLDRERIDDLFADADEITPTDPHPMIPLPPAVWAGFAGLAFVTKRVLRRKPGVSR